MSLKRKASFTTITSPSNYLTYHHPTSPIPFMGTASITVDEPPRHLHSRTRKRFRNDRPDDQTIYDKTLQWLFSAQKKPQQSHNHMAPAEEDADVLEEPSPFASSSASPDPNQQTLQKFFQPMRTFPNQQAGNTSTQLPSNDVPVTQAQWTPAARLNSTQAQLHSVSSSTASEGMDVDMEMHMDVDCAVVESDMSLEQVQEKRWVGGIGWM
ncbi:hypothetical protein AJ79_04643 [Helicocarpus griseus UAMH5409]|uniref:Uncharacterized protein n=1 Tax=Helicocarpus griseus UAMH5409 TaxID=1447875 RepID=A0A2B7XRJ1_9EURO|nr:hypothetical protein AJ79_04643 [Helicocarpus griseus UAMH5409]